MVAAAAIGAVGAVAGGVASAKGASKAASASAKGADAAAQVQWDMYDQNRSDLAPWRTVGESALNQLARLYGLATTDEVVRDAASAMLVDNSDGVPVVNEQLYKSDPVYRNAWDKVYSEHLNKFGVGYTGQSNADVISSQVRALMESDPAYQQRLSQGAPQSQQDFSSFYNSPDYRFAFDEGLRATNAGLAARGLSNSGRAMKELTRYGQGMASQQLGNYANRLASLAGVGQSAATNTAQFGANAAGNVGGAIQGSADARASGYLGQGNAINQGINNAFGTYALAKMMRGAA